MRLKLILIPTMHCSFWAIYQGELFLLKKISETPDF